MCICPSIRKCHFEVKEDVKNLCEKIFAYTKRLDEIIEYIGKDENQVDKWKIDTVLITKILLLECGIKEENKGLKVGDLEKIQGEMDEIKNNNKEFNERLQEMNEEEMDKMDIDEDLKELENELTKNESKEFPNANKEKITKEEQKNKSKNNKNNMIEA